MNGNKQGGEPVGIVTDWGHREWRLPNGKLHRDHGPAVIYDAGGEAWYRDGKLHRENAPARWLSDGTEEWFLGGVLHRLDGPALIQRSGQHEWFMQGRNITTEVEAWMQHSGITWPFNEEAVVQFKMTFC